MGRMTVKEMHRRLMLYKMVRKVVEKKKCQVGLSDGNGNSSWLCNVQDNNTESNTIIND